MQIPYTKFVSKTTPLTATELMTDPAKGYVQIQSVTVINVNSPTDKITIGVKRLDPLTGLEWKRVGVPWTNVETDSPRFTDHIFYLNKGEMVYAKFEGIGSREYGTKLELHTHGMNLSVEEDQS